MTRDEHKIVAEHIVSIIDWERIYEDTKEVSKNKFYKEDILDHIKKLVLEYNQYPDTSIKGRIETGTDVFAVHVGMFNNYMFIFSDDNFNYRKDGWFLTEERLLRAVRTHRASNKYLEIIDYKLYLRNYKLKKICQTITQTTNLVQK